MNKIFLFFLSVVVVLFIALPVLRNPNSTFFIIDPDAVYLTNIVTFLKTRQIFYYDHPGTVAIVLQSILLIPLTFYTKFVAREGFLSWTLLNFDFLALYARIVSSMVVASAFFIIFLAVNKFLKRVFLITISLLLLLSFEPIYYASISISAESTAILLAALWSFFFIKNLKSFSATNLIIMAILSGLAVANRFSAIALPIITLTIALVANDKDHFNRVKSIFIESFLILAAFIFGIFPVITNFFSMVRWVFSLSTSSEIHGRGEKSFYSIQIFYDSINRLVNIEAYRPILFLLILNLLLIVYYLAKEKSKNHFQIIGPFIALAITIFAFLKYPLAHYQTTNFIVLISMSVFFLRFIRRSLLIAFSTILIIPAHIAFTNYSSTVNEMIIETQNVEEFSENNEPIYSRVWDWSRNTHFAMIWSRHYSGVYSEALTKHYPYLYAIHHNLEDIRLNSGDQPLFSVCWDQLYLQKSTLPFFLEKHKDRKFSIQKIQGSKTMVMVTSDHCTTKP